MSVIHRRLCVLGIVMVFLVGATGSASAKYKGGTGSGVPEDYDPYVDIWVTVTIDEINAFDHLDDDYGPDFWWVVEIGTPNDDLQLEWVQDYSNVYNDCPGGHLEPGWSFSADVNDKYSYVGIKIALYECDYLLAGPAPYQWSEICDISPDSGGGGFPGPADDGSDVEITYFLAFGTVAGDDETGGSSRAFHVSGNEDYTSRKDFDRSVDENDCEIYCTVTQTEHPNDGDGLTWYEETRYYGTSPTQDNTGWDLDGDGMPIEYEDRYYCLSDLNANDADSDPDGDNLTNWQEYCLRAYGTDPDIPDIFIEMDYKQGNRPDDWVINYIHDFFWQLRLPDGHHGANVVIDLDDELPASITDPNGNGYTDDLELDDPDPAVDDDILATCLTPGREGSWRYCLITDKLAPVWVWDGDEWVEWWGVKGGCWFATPRAMAIADWSIDADVDDHDWWCVGKPNIARVEAVAHALMHELGHNLDIIDHVDNDGDGRVVEDYCDDSTCVMARWNCCDVAYANEGTLTPRYCEYHWNQIDLDVWSTVDLNSNPDQDDSDPNV